MFYCKCRGLRELKHTQCSWHFSITVYLINVFIKLFILIMYVHIIDHTLLHVSYQFFLHISPISLHSCLFVQESTFNEQVEGLIEEDEEAKTETEHAETDSKDVAVGPPAQPEKKTERQRKKEKAERIKVMRGKNTD